MQKLRPALKKIIPLGIASAVLDMVLHAVLAPTYPYDYPASVFVESGPFRPAAAISLFIIFLPLSVVFIAIQENLPGGFWKM